MQPTSTITSQYGVWGYLSGSPATSTNNYGVFGDLSNLSAGNLGASDVYYAVYGAAPAGTAGTPGYNTSGSNPYSAYAGYFAGDVFITGATYCPSDEKLKMGVTKYAGALDKLNQLNVKSYTFKQSEYPTLNLPGGEQIGVLAQEVSKVFPGLVKHSIQPASKKGGDKVEYDGVNYTALVPVLVEAIQELDAKTASSDTTVGIIQQQQGQIAQLTQQVAELKSMLSDICNLGCPGLQNSSGNNEAVVLYQSIPNPTSTSATIGYVINIPFTSANITVTSTDGNVVQEYKIAQGGKGSVVFNGGQYSSGTFRYSLYIDGKLFDTKTIVIAKD